MIVSPLMSVLHISDFHFAGRKKREQGIAVDALIKDLKSLCIGHRKPDLIIFTGDLVYAAGVDGHDEAYDFLIDPISKTTGCSDERIFIVPGNHDAEREGIQEFLDEFSEIRSAIGTNNEMEIINEMYDGGKFESLTSRKFQKFYELEKYLRGHEGAKSRIYSSPFATVDYIQALNIDIVVLNSAVLSSGGIKGIPSDERKLIIPEYALIEISRNLNPESFRIFATHHPISMLSEQSAKILEAYLGRNANIHLFGHMHDPQPKQSSGLTGDLLSSQAGAIFTTRSTYNGYSLITIDRSTGLSETMIRSFYKDRGCFDEGVDIVESGRWYPSQAARQHFRKIAAPIDDKKFREHLRTVTLEQLRAEEAEAGGEADLHNWFVPPPLCRTFIQEITGDEGKVEVEAPISFSDVVGGDANLIIYGRAEYGRTTLLREIRYRLLDDAEQVGFPRFPVLIDFSVISSNSTSLLRTIRARAEGRPESNDIESLLKLGHACIIIDDVQFGDIRRMKIIREFVERFPKARYIFSSLQSSVTQYGAFIDPEMPVRFEFVEVREFRRNDMRQLLTKYQQCTDVEGWLDRLQNEFREINLPFTAANGSILIDILAEKHNFMPINRAVLMEQFVDSTLRKAAIEQSRREIFDYTNKTDLLAHVAAWMAKNDEYVPSREAVRYEMKSYIDRRGLNASLDDLMHEFLQSRIFVNKADGRISFRYKGVLEYFIALKMISDNNFKEWILEDDRYLRYVNEIQYYAGKHRNDAELVNLVRSRYDDILREATADLGEIDLSSLENINVPPSDGFDSFDETISGVFSSPLSQDEKDAELEADFPKDAEERQEVFRPLIKDISDKMLLSLVLYSGLVKNMELISDSEKRAHLRNIWKGWSTLLVAALRVSPRLAKERRMRVNGALYEMQAPHGMKDGDLLRMMMLKLPHVHIRALSNVLGTEKLERQLIEPTLDEMSDPLIFSLLRGGLITELRLSGTPRVIDDLFHKFRDSKYLSWSLIVHVGELRRLGRIRDDHFRELDEPLAVAYSNLKGGSPKERADEKRRQLARLSKDRLILTLKRDREV